jgi:hypothetical protein
VSDGEASTRRGLFRSLAGQARRTAADRLPVLEHPVRPDVARAPAIPPARRALLIEDLLEIADEVGLGHRSAAIEHLTRTSFRIVERPGRERREDGHRIWGDRPRDERAAGPVVDVARIDLSRLRSLDAPSGLPATGMLEFGIHEDLLDDSDAEPFELLSPVVSFRDADNRRPTADGAPSGVVAAATVELLPELCLPRLWTAWVQDVGLEEPEWTAWESLRSTLAERQGTRPFESETGTVVLHRALGYPDERVGQMRAVCDEASAATSSRWCLLLQLTIAGRPEYARLAPDAERLYFWIAEDALRRADFTAVRAFVQ